jgi:hypothetical protein
MAENSSCPSLRCLEVVNHLLALVFEWGRLWSVPSLNIYSAEASAHSCFLGVFRAEALSSPWHLHFLMAEVLEDSGSLYVRGPDDSVCLQSSGNCFQVNFFMPASASCLAYVCLKSRSHSLSSDPGICKAATEDYPWLSVLLWRSQTVSSHGVSRVEASCWFCCVQGSPWPVSWPGVYRSQIVTWGSARQRTWCVPLWRYLQRIDCTVSPGLRCLWVRGSEQFRYSRSRQGRGFIVVSIPRCLGCKGHWIPPGFCRMEALIYSPYLSVCGALVTVSDSHVSATQRWCIFSWIPICVHIKGHSISPHSSF